MGVLLTIIFFPVLVFVAIAAAVRGGKLIFRLIDGLFTKIEDKVR